MAVFSNCMITADKDVLFRNNNLATKVLMSYCKKDADRYIRGTLDTLITEICQSPTSFPVRCDDE